VSVRDLNFALTIFSAMLTPVILISATGSLTISTSQRLGRAIERARAVAEMIEAMVKAEPTGPLFEERKRLIFMMLRRITDRVGLLQRSLMSLYLSVLMFIVTSVALGVLALTGINHAELALIFAGIGVLLLFYSVLLLIVESRIARSNLDAEMDFVLRLGETYAPTDIRHTFQPKPRRIWFQRKATHS
jgi:hypothetical protein